MFNSFNSKLLKNFYYDKNPLIIVFFSLISDLNPLSTIEIDKFRGQESQTFQNA